MTDLPCGKRRHPDVHHDLVGDTGDRSVVHHERLHGSGSRSERTEHGEAMRLDPPGSEVVTAALFDRLDAIADQEADTQ
jgi:hypothetical protein